MKQAEAEVVPSSSLVEVEVEVGVELEVGVWVWGFRVKLTFSVRWVVEDLESKANLNSSLSFS